MRICVISTPIFSCPPAGYSGLEMLAWQRAEGLAQRGHQVALIAPEGSRCSHSTLIPIGPPGQWDERRAYQHYQEALSQFDVIIDETWAKWSYLMKAEGRLKSPVLGVCHAPISTMYQSLPPVENPCFVCISKDQAAHFAGLFSREAKVAYNGIDLDFYKPLGIPRSKRFLFLARFSTIKGPDLAIEACRKVGVGLDLVGDTQITGEPEFLKRCQSLCDTATVGEFAGDRRTAKVMDDLEREFLREEARRKTIRMVGPATRGECVYWFSQAHCMLHPNQRFREPFGLAPVEAMACGCPVIAWDNGAMRETVKHAETGWLVSSQRMLEDAITAATNIPDDNRRLCREWAAQFSVQSMIARYEELCQEAIETGGW